MQRKHIEDISCRSHLDFLSLIFICSKRISDDMNEIYSTESLLSSNSLEEKKITEYGVKHSSFPCTICQINDIALHIARGMTIIKVHIFILIVLTRINNLSIEFNVK